MNARIPCRWRLAWSALLAVASWIPPANAQPVRVTDDAGAVVSLPAPARRVVSLLPSLTESVCMLDACDRLVGVDRWSNWPARVNALPRVGGLDDASVERIMALKPDLVLADRSARVVDRLRSLGVPVAAFAAQDLADVPRVLGAVGTLVGSARAPVLWRQANAAIDAAARAGASRPALRVYMEVDAAPWAAGEASFIGGLLARLGARNVVPAALGPFPKLNPEFVVRADPQVVIVAAREAGALGRRPGWADLRALRAGQGHVCAFGPAGMDVLVRPGPRIAEAAGLLSRCLDDAAARIAPPGKAG